jgi:geranylgeranyl diphosphate synthase type II
MIERYLAEMSVSELPELDGAALYSLLAPGKRIRPLLCLAAAKSAGADPRDALPAAAALEMVHAFSLVHDDLPALDDDDERRGKPTSHVRFGEGVAVLVGDALLTAAFRHVAERLGGSAEVRLAVLGELARGVSGMIDGQYLDVTADGPPSYRDLVRIHKLKTGALITCSVLCGLHVAGVDDEAKLGYKAFAEELGLLFQIVDDILDGGDDGEASFVTTLGMQRAKELAAEAHLRARALLAGIDADTGELAELTELIARRTG